MSKFQRDDILRVIDASDNSLMRIGDKCTVLSCDRDYVYVKWINNPNLDEGGWDCSRFELISSKRKPAKKYTETERRKAAKDVRAARDKLAKLVDKAKETGINVSFTNASIGMIDIVMDFQPETPKKRVY